MAINVKGNINAVKENVQSKATSVKDTAQQLPEDIKDTVQRVFAAGLGALDLAGEEGGKLYAKLVEQGEKMGIEVPGREQVEALKGQVSKGLAKVQHTAEEVEADAEELAVKADAEALKAQIRTKGAVARVKAEADEAAQKAEHMIQDVVTGVLSKIGVPTRNEIRALISKVERLADEVDTLSKTKKPSIASAPKAKAYATPAPVAKVAVPEPTPQPSPVVETPAEDKKADEEFDGFNKLGGGWYELLRNGKVVEKVQGPVEKHYQGGGWYSITIGGQTVDKVQGKDIATARFEAIAG